MPPTEPEPPRPVLALIGLRCSGKTTLGRLLAERLELPFVDLDDALLQLARLDPDLAHHPSAGELLSAVGVEAFRELESDALARVLADERPCVLATGGGAVEIPANRARLAERALCVWLRADVATLGARLATDATTRPALDGDDPVAELAETAARRAPWYRELALLDLETDRAPPSTLAVELVARLAPPASAGFRLVPPSGPRDRA